MSTYFRVGRSTIGEIRIGDKAIDDGSHTSGKRPEIGRTSILPVGPDLVDHLGKEGTLESELARTCFAYRMVQYEQGIYEDVRIAYSGFRGVVTEDAPLGDHLGPEIQGEGALNGQLP